LCPHFIDTFFSSNCDNFICWLLTIKASLQGKLTLWLAIALELVVIKKGRKQACTEWTEVSDASN